MRARTAIALVLGALVGACSVPDYEVVDDTGVSIEDSSVDVLDGGHETSVDSGHDTFVSDAPHDGSTDSGADTHVDAKVDSVADSVADSVVDSIVADSGVDSIAVDTAPDTFDAGCTASSCPTGSACCGGACIDTTSDVTNCGGCGVVCPSSLGTPACVGGSCRYSACDPGLGDCDGSGRCGTAIHDDVSNCGGCGVTCSVSNGAPKCTGTTCGIAACTSGFADCDSSYATGCETPLNTLTDCGGCGVACTLPEASSTSCGSGTCVVVSCASGFDDCDKIESNGCETNLSSTSDCGACGNKCSAPHATSSCTASGCGIGSCDAGFANCDGSVVNGCERQMSAATNTCATPTALTNSVTGTTQICGYGFTTTTNAVSNTGDTFDSVQLRRCAGGCNSGNPMRAKIVLQSPAGMAFDLYVYSDAACGTLVGSSKSGVLGGTETVKWIDTACPANRTLIIETRWRSGDGCGSATLNVTGDYTPYP